MSLRRKAFHSIVQANDMLGGSRAIKVARSRQGRQLVEFCFSRGIAIGCISEVPAELLKNFITHLGNPPEGQKKNSTGTIQNKISSIRRLMAAQGADLEKLGVDSSKALGVGQRSRKGTKEPIPDEMLSRVLQEARAIGEIGMYHSLRIERYLGMRGLEAVMSTAALLKYAREARAMADGTLTAIHIFDGTKGGRPRETAVILKHAHLTLQVIQEALEFATKNGGYLISGGNAGLKSARSLYHRIAGKIGLTGKYSPHSLRYAYAVDKLMELRDLDVPQLEARGLVASWLGHGSGRGRWVSMVYGQSVSHSLTRSTRRDAQSRAATQIQQMFEGL